MRISFILLFFLWASAASAQNFEERVLEAERLMVTGEYAPAKYALTFAIGDLDVPQYNALRSELRERAENDLTETQIRTGDWELAMSSFQQPVKFKDYDEGVRHFHLECLLMQQGAVKAAYGKDPVIAREVHQAETALRLIAGNRGFFRRAEYCELQVYEDLLVAYWEKGDDAALSRTMDAMRTLAVAVPDGRSDWPAFYWYFTAVRLVDTGRESQAEPLLRKVLEHLLRYDASHAYMPFSSLVGIAQRKGDKEEIHSLLLSTATELREHGLKMLRSMTEHDRYALGRDEKTIRAYNLLTVLPEGTYEDVLYGASLFSKAVLNDLFREMADNISRISDPTLSDAFWRMQFASGSNYSWYENMLFLKEYRRHQPKEVSTDYSWKEVQRQLGDNDVAIEFLRTGKNYQDYTALLVRKGWSRPLAVRLCSETDLSSLNADAGTHRGRIARDGYRLLIRPLEPFLKHGDHVYYSPDGKMARFNLDAFVSESGQCAGDIYKLHRVRTTRVLPAQKKDLSFDNIFLYGGMDYDASIDDMLDMTVPVHKVTPLVVYEKRDAVPASFDFGWTKNGERSGYAPLPYSMDEVRQIWKDWPDRNHCFAYVKTYAAEEMFKHRVYGTKPSERNIFHISTHSFHVDDDEYMYGLSREEEAFKMDGLLFSGASHALHHEPLPENMNDGLLYAAEIARMDFRSADMVVLSACNTAGGEDSLDGILGLQRAFKRAGAETIVMTLWNVDDLTTAVFMANFYRELSRRGSKYDAFVAARNVVRALNDDPYYWAPFVMLD